MEPGAALRAAAAVTVNPCWTRTETVGASTQVSTAPVLSCLIRYRSGRVGSAAPRSAGSGTRPSASRALLPLITPNPRCTLAANGHRAATPAFPRAASPRPKVKVKSKQRAQKSTVLAASEMWVKVQAAAAQAMCAPAAPAHSPKRPHEFDPRREGAPFTAPRGTGPLESGPAYGPLTPALVRRP